MKDFWNVPILWNKWGIVKVPKEKCPTVKEACDLVLNETPLPDGEYVSDSCEIDFDGLAIHNPELEEK